MCFIFCIFSASCLFRWFVSVCIFFLCLLFFCIIRFVFFVCLFWVFFLLCLVHLLLSIPLFLLSVLPLLSLLCYSFEMWYTVGLYCLVVSTYAPPPPTFLPTPHPHFFPSLWPALWLWLYKLIDCSLCGERTYNWTISSLVDCACGRLDMV